MPEKEPVVLDSVARSQAPYAFRCNACGFLEHSDHAAESLHPHACRVCGGGVSFHPRTGVKSFDAGNWEVLCDATPERLAELGLSGEQVERHEPWPKGHDGDRPAEHIHATASEGVSGADVAE